MVYYGCITKLDEKCAYISFFNNIFGTLTYEIAKKFDVDLKNDYKVGQVCDSYYSLSNRWLKCASPRSIWSISASFWLFPPSNKVLRTTRIFMWYGSFLVFSLHRVKLFMVLWCLLLLIPFMAKNLEISMVCWSRSNTEFIVFCLYSLILLPSSPRFSTCLIIFKTTRSCLRCCKILSQSIAWWLFLPWRPMERV